MIVLPHVQQPSYFAVTPAPSRIERSNASYFTGTLEFVNLVKNRIQYLDSLKNLDDNWISGESAKAPIENNLKIAKDILSSLLYLHQSKPESQDLIPQLIMGPVPDGGMSIQLNYQNVISIDINISTDSKILIEYEKNNVYSEFLCRDISDLITFIKNQVFP